MKEISGSRNMFTVQALDSAQEGHQKHRLSKILDSLVFVLRRTSVAPRIVQIVENVQKVRCCKIIIIKSTPYVKSLLINICIYTVPDKMGYST